MTPPRLASLDALRGLNVLVMLLVNELATVRGVPAWMKHAAPGREGITFVDLVLPLFLFLLGLSVPLALERHRQQGEPPLRTLAHVLRRGAALLLAGVFLVNMPEAADAMGMPAPLWRLLVVLTLLTLLHQGPAQGAGRRVSQGLRGLALLALLALGLRYRGLAQGQLVTLHPQWYGILGILGWAYLNGCALFLLAGANLAAVVGALALLIAVHLGDRAGGFQALGAPWALVLGPALGPCNPIAIAGVFAGALLLPGSPAPTNRAQTRWLLALGVGLVLAGLALRPLHPVYKPTASPSYVLVSAGLCCPLYLGGRWLLERARRWTLPLQRLGEDALLPFFVPTLLYAAVDLYERDLLTQRYGAGPPGVLRALGVTVVALLLVALLRRAHLRLRL